VYLVVQPDDMTREKFLCLAQELDKRYALAKDVTAFIFSSRLAAEQFDASGMNLERGDFRRDLRAMFQMNLGKSSLTITPIGVAFPYFQEAPRGGGIIGEVFYNTRIDLPMTGPPPHCRLEIVGRCLMALEPVSYPNEALATHLSGTVTLDGTIERDGTVMVTTVVPRDGVPPIANDLFANAALTNLKTWRLEGGQRQDSFRVTFSYVIDSTLKPGQIDIQFDLPKQVKISSNSAQ